MIAIIKINTIMHKFTIFYNSKQNEFTKKSMYIIWDNIKTLFKNIDLNINFWSKIIRFKIYFLNRSSINAFKEKITFYQIWEHVVSNLNHYKIVENVEYKIISRVFLKLFNDKVEKCIFLRYDDSN